MPANPQHISTSERGWEKATITLPRDLRKLMQAEGAREAGGVKWSVSTAIAAYLALPEPVRDQLVAYMMAIGRNRPERVMPDEAREALQRLDRTLQALDERGEGGENADLGWFLDRVLDPRLLGPQAQSHRKQARRKGA